jgi:hypothetical protein
MTERTLADLDRDEALTEVVAELHGPTRAALLRGAVIGSAGMAAALLAPASAGARISDTALLQFALRFEYLQATFYTQAVELGTVHRMGARRRRWARTLGAHERAHVRILKDVLGPKAAPKPAFDFGNANETVAGFTKTAVAFEDLTVALLSGMTPRVRNAQVRAAFLGLLTVEARHAAWARNIVGAVPSPEPFDRSRSLRSVRGTIARTHFIDTRPKTSSTMRPTFMG